MYSNNCKLLHKQIKYVHTLNNTSFKKRYDGSCMSIRIKNDSSFITNIKMCLRKYYPTRLIFFIITNYRKFLFPNKGKYI